MNSPFPGMNPYLESPNVWHDFHQRFVIHLSEEIAAQLTDNYIATLEQTIYVQDLSNESLHLHRADVALLGARKARSDGAVAMLEPPPVQLQLIPVSADRERESYIEIRHLHSWQLITVIELLSPANKLPGKDRDQYLAKRERLLESSVHLVEIDLLRRGQRMPALSFPPCDYCLLMSRAEFRPIFDAWPFQVTEPIPPLFVPLRSEDAVVRVDMQNLFQDVFTKAGYSRFIYDSPLDPPLSPELKAWVDGLVQQGRRHPPAKT